MQTLVRVQAQVRASRVEAMERRNRQHHSAMLRDGGRWRAGSQVLVYISETRRTPWLSFDHLSYSLRCDSTRAGRRHLGGQPADAGGGGRADEAEGGGRDQARESPRLRLLPSGTVPQHM
jgi:hypothetical protein